MPCAVTRAVDTAVRRCPHLPGGRVHGRHRGTAGAEADTCRGAGMHRVPYRHANAVHGCRTLLRMGDGSCTSGAVQVAWSKCQCAAQASQHMLSGCRRECRGNGCTTPWSYFVQATGYCQCSVPPSCHQLLCQLYHTACRCPAVQVRGAVLLAPAIRVSPKVLPPKVCTQG